MHRRHRRRVCPAPSNTVTDDSSDHWSAYRADQIVTPVPPAFVWDARVRVASLLHVRVRDAYVDGRGVGQVSLLSAISLSQEEGGAELNAGELYRYLPEAVWFPTGLLPSAGGALEADRRQQGVGNFDTRHHHRID
jgi:hypothetical protein